MKHRILSVIGFFILLAAGAAAQKIAVVDMKAIADRSQRVQSELQKSQDQIRDLQEKLDAKMAEMQRARDQLNARRSAMTETETAAQEEKAQRLREEYDDMQAALNKQINQIQRQVVRPQAERIQKIIAGVAKQQNIDLVIDSEAAIYHSDSIDITPLVVQIFDREGASPDAAPSSSSASDSSASAASSSSSAKSSDDSSAAKSSSSDGGSQGSSKKSSAKRSTRSKRRSS